VARQLAADGGDDKEITKAEGKMRDAQDRSATLSGAIVDIDKIIAGLEREVEQIIDRRMRVETNLALAAMVTRLEKAQAAHASSALELEMSCRECALVALEANAVAAFTMDLRQQLEPAIPTIIEGLKHHARAVAAGTARPSLP
jgi:predicted  nucleic acid-binding Zn-ribbon protein